MALTQRCRLLPKLLVEPARWARLWRLSACALAVLSAACLGPSAYAQSQQQNQQDSASNSGLPEERQKALVAFMRCL